MSIIPLVLADNGQLRTALMLLDQALELPIEQFQTARDLLPPVRPAFLPVVKLVFGDLLARAALIEVLVQSQ